MLIYVEDVIVVNLFIFILSAITLGKFIRKKRGIRAIFLGVTNTVLTIFLPSIVSYANVAILALCLIVAFFVYLDDMFVKSVRNAVTYTVFVGFYSLITAITGFVLPIVNLSANVLIYLGILMLAYLVVNVVIDNLLRKKHALTADVKINEKQVSAVVDSGNKVTYNGKGVIVLTKKFENEVNKTENILEIKTINSSKFYPVFNISKLIVNGENEKFFYDVPCIIEERSDRVILPLNYQ